LKDAACEIGCPLFLFRLLTLESSPNSDEPGNDYHDQQQQ
jgi:hypothetical protein